jgi:hypothetical protein
VPGLRILGPDGRFYPVRCKRRECAYCARLANFELAQSLLIDARHTAPAHCLTLTTRKPWQQLDPAEYREGSRLVWRRLRRHFGSQIGYAGQVEFTTGRAARSGGHRRQHSHHLVKGLEGVDVLEVERLVAETWERATGAYVVEVAELRSPGAAIAYLGLHHRKPEQAPPKGWRGMTFRASQNYWHRPVAEIRELARVEQRERRLRYRYEASGMPSEAAEELAALAAAGVKAEAAGRLVEVREAAEGGVIRPV